MYDEFDGRDFISFTQDKIDGILLWRVFIVVHHWLLVTLFAFGVDFIVLSLDAVVLEAIGTTSVGLSFIRVYTFLCSFNVCWLFAWTV